MSKAIAMIQDLGKKMGRKEHQECRTLQLNMPETRPVDIEFTNITLTVSEGFRSRKKKTILKGVSGLFKSGQLTAIMGPSGAGKSSLLNALTGFSTSGLTGEIRAGDSVCQLSTRCSLRSLKTYGKKSSYIMQDDRLNPMFTVGELMKFAADMKLGNTITEKLKQSVISDILDTLGLFGTENTRCGNLSGGQKKRMSIAVELIDNPPVLFLDEPTTGLDSRSSAQCMEMLKELARKGRTIVCTIHQPPASVYSIFDQVYILAEGLCIYNGPSENTVPYLASVGLQCPKYHNPADYILEVAAGEYGKLNKMLADYCTRHGRQDKAALPIADKKRDALSCGKTTIIVAPPHELYRFGILLRRCILQQYRDWTVTHLKVIMHAIIGILLGLFYQDAGSDASKAVSNVGYLLVSTVFLCYTSIMPAVLKIPSEMSILKKENFNNWYDLKTYYAALIATSMPMQVVYSFVYCLPSYFLSGQPVELPRFLMFVLVLSNVSLLAEAFGNVIGTCVNPINGTFLGAILTCTLLLYGGFLLLFAHMSPVMRVISYASFIRHAFEALVLALYSYGRIPLVCPASVDYCHLRHPLDIIKQFNMKPDNYWIDIVILIAEIVLVRIIAYFTLRRSVKRSV